MVFPYPDLKVMIQYKMEYVQNFDLLDPGPAS